jgi:hypothetical protein
MQSHTVSMTRALRSCGDPAKLTCHSGKDRRRFGPTDLAERDSIRFEAARPHLYRGHARQNRAVLLMLHPET